MRKNSKLVKSNSLNVLVNFSFLKFYSYNTMQLLRTANDIRIFILANIVVHHIKIIPLSRKMFLIFNKFLETNS